MKPEMRERLALDWVQRLDSRSAVRAAQQKDQLPEVLRWLAGQEDWLVRWAALVHPALPVDVMFKVAGSRVSGDRVRVFQNPGLPVEVLRREAEILFLVPGPPSAEVTAELAAILSSDRAWLELLVRGLWSGVPGWAVAAAGNPVLPESLAVQVLRRGTILMRARLVVNGGVSAAVVAGHDWSRERSVAVLLAVLPRVRGKVRAEVLGRLASHGVTGRRVAAKKSRDPVLIAGLAHDADPATADAAAGNRMLPAETAAELLRTGSVSVRAAVAGNDGLTEAVWAAHDWSGETASAVLIAALWRVEGAAREVVLDLLAVSDVLGREAAARLSCNVAAVTVLCGDSEAWIRATAASNPVASEEGRVWEALLR